MVFNSVLYRVLSSVGMLILKPLFHPYTNITSQHKYESVFWGITYNQAIG